MAAVGRQATAIYQQYRGASIGPPDLSRRVEGRGFGMRFAFAVTLFFCALVPAASASAAEQLRPNVLFIISDDLTATALSCYGNTICRTPNIDRLGGQGTRFTR